MHPWREHLSNDQRKRLASLEKRDAREKAKNAETKAEIAKLHAIAKQNKRRAAAKHKGE